MPTGTYIVIDLETTGLDPALESILEVAAVRLEAGREAAVYHRLVRPETPISSASQAIHGITPEMVLDAPGLDTVLPELEAFIGELPLVAHNAPFDVAFLNRARAKAGRGPLANPVYDTLELAKEALPDQRSFKLEALCRALDHPAETFHRALDDARHLAAIFPRLIGLYRQKQAWYRLQFERIEHVAVRFDQLTRLVDGLQGELNDLKRILGHYFAEHPDARVPLFHGEALVRSSKEIWDYDTDQLYPLLDSWGIKDRVLKLDRARLERYMAGDRLTPEQKAAIAATRTPQSVAHRFVRAPLAPNPRPDAASSEQPC